MIDTICMFVLVIGGALLLGIPLGFVKVTKDGKMFEIIKIDKPELTPTIKKISVVPINGDMITADDAFKYTNEAKEMQEKSDDLVYPLVAEYVQSVIVKSSNKGETYTYISIYEKIRDSSNNPIKIYTYFIIIERLLNELKEAGYDAKSTDFASIKVSWE